MASLSATSVPSYRGVFDHSIYDQSEYLKNHSGPNIKEEGLKALLLQKKGERLHKVLLNTAQSRFQEYTNIAEGGVPFLHKIDVNDNPILKEGVQHVNNLWNHWLQPIAEIINVNLKAVDKVVTPIEKDEAKKRLFDLAFEIKLMIEGLDKERICDLELEYILKKRLISSTEIKSEIEKILLLSREDGAAIEIYREFIDNALKMPYNKIDISTPGYNAMEKVLNSEGFTNFDRDLQFKLKGIAKKLIVDSNTPVSGTCTRSFYYFWGNPSTGKSTTARMIPEKLGLPFNKCTFKDSTDLSRENLEGTHKSFFSHNPGLFAHTLMSKNSVLERPFFNAVLIIEDFDQILFQSGDVTKSLTFLLDYLDPEKIDFFSPYFNAKINISMLSIFITANQRIPPKPTKANEVDKFAALRSRVTEIHFPDFPPETIKSICLPYAETLGIKYQLSPSFIQENKEKWFKKAIETQANRGAVIELRNLKREIELKVVEDLFPEDVVAKRAAEDAQRADEEAKRQRKK